MSATIIQFPTQSNAILEAWIAFDALSMIHDAPATLSPHGVNPRGPSRIPGIVAVAGAAQDGAHGGSDRTRARAITAATNAMPLVLNRMRAWERKGSVVDDRTETDTLNAEAAVLVCWDAAEVAIAECRRQGAREWMVIAEDMRTMVAEPLRAALDA